MKRLLDILGAIAGIVLLAPVILSVAILVKLSIGSPVIFSQIRPGVKGKPFRLVKLRTMKDIRDNVGGLLDDKERITRFGNALRRSSMDELPELWNVLKGDMSLVGPRPLLMEYLPRYTKEQARRHEVRPGITGWAQVNGRNSISWEERFSLDVWYVDNHTFLLDLKILWLTLIKVFRKEDISCEGHATMPEFTGKIDNGQHHDARS